MIKIGRCAKPILLFFIAAVTLITFYPSLGNGFINRDDDVMLLNNPLIRELTWASVLKIFTTLERYFYYMPLVDLSFAVEYRFFGLHPFVYHLTNLLLHVFNAILVFMILDKIVKNRWQALVCALLFALHPQRVESVAWVSERKDVLFSLFFLLSFWFYLLKEGSKNHRREIFSIFFFICALLSKPTATILPLILILYDMYAKHNFHLSLKNKIPYFVLMIASLWIGLLNTGRWQIILEQSLAQNGLVVGKLQMLHATDAVLFYIQKILWPIHLSPIYPFPLEPGQLIHAHPAISPIFLVLGIFLAFLSLKSRPLLFFGIGFFLITLLPSLFFSLYGYINDRYTYLPSIGIFLCVTSPLFEVNNKRFLSAVGCVLAGVILMFGLISWDRCGVWKNSVVHWADAVDYEPTYFFPYYGRGVAYQEINDPGQAAQDFETAIWLNPKFGLAKKALSDLKLQNPSL